MNNQKKETLIPRELIFPFLLVTILFPMWGFAADITNPLVAAFSRIFLISNFEGALIQFCFYGGYCAIAIPAAIFIRKHSYKSGIMLGLGLYASGALLFIPSAWIADFYPFLISYFIMTCGLSFLETSAGPYILSMGDARKATQRLNLAQSFYPIGSLIGMFTAKNYIQVKLNDVDTATRKVLFETNPEQFKSIQLSDLDVVSSPYIFIGGLLVVLIVIYYLSKMPHHFDSKTPLDIKATLKRLKANPRFKEGVVAQFCYVGAEVMCWTFIIHYGVRVFMNEGMTEKEAEQIALQYNIYAMITFGICRFLFTYLLNYIKSGQLLKIVALTAIGFTLSLIFIDGRWGIYSFIGISGCLSMMWPTIFGSALTGMKSDSKIASAGMIVVIGGGSLLPPLQGKLIDIGNTTGQLWGIPAVNASFILVLLCFMVITIYGYRLQKIHEPKFDATGELPKEAQE
ncbi:L-fucose:H+ symporter permease [Flammeovirga sp. EKP202]|uniref:L-fucose:H+ symporter permease n=1 Tax=Flammeovirga sp. EKP202 TaxID=2770592 RepID=UPI00165ED8D2|nr:L-fucose:H+ symporter permease [Flammeovirga sp. EKP202]MBD0401727.1 L-fucose:H+ symporter permease [Flammeovirga sp. EKP202]